MKEQPEKIEERYTKIIAGIWPITTYIYFRSEDGKCVHCNCVAGIIGEEYEHDDPNWQPPKDWPYKIIDKRK